MQNDNYIVTNKKLWNTKTEFHLKSNFYNNKDFVKGQNSLNKIELDLLGDLKGKSILHLQCHFGQDTISLQRLGAEVTGVDFSEKAIEAAKELAVITNSNATFICSDIYDLTKVLNQKFDLVFTSYGTIGWLPDLDQWAAIINHFLKTDGEFVFVEFHPVVWVFDEDFSKVKYNYFKSDPIVEKEAGTYADKEAKINLESITWNHSISEVVNSLIKNQLVINSLNEYNYSPYNCFNQTKQVSKNKFVIKHFENKIPMVYAITATKNSH